MGYFNPKITHPQKLFICSKDFFKFCTMKGAKRYMKITSIVLPKKISKGRFWAQK